MSSTNILGRVARAVVISLFLYGIAVLIQLPAFATQSVTLAWNSSSDPTVVGYNIYYGGASRDYTNTLSAGNATNITVSGLVMGDTYYFAATTYNSSGVQSPFSSEVSYSVPTNSVPVNQPPTLNPINNLTINENAGPQTVNLYGIGSGATNENQNLTVTASSSNTNLIPSPTVNYTSPNTNGSLTFTPVANANGKTTISVTVNDGGTSNNIITRSFTVTVSAVNQPPTLNPVSNLTINENAGLQTVTLSGITSGAANENQTLTVTATSGNINLIPNPTVHYTSANTNGSLTFSPLTNANGSAVITVTVNDGGASNNLVTQTFTVTVSPVNQPPTLNPIKNLTIYENVGLQTVTLSGITSGAANENQTLTVTATSSNTNLIPNPIINYTSANVSGSLTFTPVTNSTGSAVISVSVNDGGASNNLVTQTFTVNVQPINDKTPPTDQISTPTSNQQWTNGSFTVTGKASDNVAVGTVYYSFNGSGWTAAATTNSWTNWTANITLTPGTNTVQAYAVDTSGNFSPTNTVKFEYVVRQPLAVQIFGLGIINPKCGSLNPNYTNGTPLAINENYKLTANAASGFAFTNWTSGSGTLLTNRATLLFTMATNLSLKANFVDVTKPTLSIQTPTANQQWTNGTFTATGKAGDNVAVSAVYYQLNGSGWTAVATTNNWTNWTANLTLTPGTNTLQAYAVDTTGNLSSTNTVKFEYVVRKPLTVQIFGLGVPNPKWGSLNPNYTNGTLLAINENFTLTANPASGFAFTNWTSGSGTLLTNRATLYFTMVTNLSLKANFVDVTKPTLSIQTPTANQQLTNGTFTATGKAGDNVAVSAVYYQLNGSGWTAVATANNWTNWTANLTLTPGTNTLQAYAVDTSGNFSSTNKVTFAYKTAPNSLAGLMAGVNESGGGTFYLCFGASTFSQNSGNTNYDNGVGNYNYTKLSPDTAQLSITYTAPPDISGGRTVVLLTFITNNECTFSNPSNVLDTGTLNLWSVPNWAPASLNGKTSALIAGGKRTTLAFGSSTLTLTNADGQVTNGNYTFKSYSPLGALLTVTQPGETNFLLLTFGATNYGSYAATVYDSPGNAPTTGTGVFAILSEALGGNAPNALANGAAVVTQPDGSFEMNFGAATFSQNSFLTNYANGVGTYTYTKSSADSAVLSFNYTAPPNVANAAAPVVLTFIAPNFCVLTNQDDLGSNYIVAMSFWAPPTNWVPTALAGLTMLTTNAAGVADVVTFNGDGTFSQTETGSSNPGVSTGSYTFTQDGPLGGMLVLTYSGGVDVGSTSYIQTTFTSPGTGSLVVTFYDASADPPVTSFGNFTIDQSD